MAKIGAKMNFFILMLSIVYSNLLVPRGIASSAIGLKICAVAVGIEKYKLLIKKKKRSMIKGYC